MRSKATGTQPKRKREEGRKGRGKVEKKEGEGAEKGKPGGNRRKARGKTEGSLQSFGGRLQEG